MVTPTDLSVAMCNALSMSDDDDGDQDDNDSNNECMMSSEVISCGSLKIKYINLLE